MVLMIRMFVIVLPMLVLNAYPKKKNIHIYNKESTTHSRANNDSVRDLKACII